MRKIRDKYVRVELRRLFTGYASVRDYVLDNIMAEKKGIRFVVDGHTMSIPYKKLKHGRRTGKKFLSKFGSDSYELVDFVWKEDPEVIDTHAQLVSFDARLQLAEAFRKLKSNSR